MSQPNYIEILIPKNSDEPTVFTESCISVLLDEIKKKHRNLNRADQLIPRDTLYGLERKLGTQENISIQILFNLALTAGYDGFQIRYE